jgi:branched-chain amino acid transport system substrate-binding protein
MEETMITRRQVVVGLSAAGALTALPVRAQTPVVRIGVLVDMSGLYRDTGGPTAVACARQAVKDLGIAERGVQVEVLVADHQNKPDIGVSVARRWFDVDGVDAITEVNNSAVAFGVSKLARDMDKVFLASGPASVDLTGSACSPNTVHAALDTYCRAKSTVSALVSRGGKTWSFITADYAFGKSLYEQASKIIEKEGGSVLGNSLYPFGSTFDYSSFILSATARKPQVIGMANTSSDLGNCLKQMREFGLDPSNLNIAILAGFITEMRAMGLDITQDLMLTETFYWDLNDRTRAFMDRIRPSVPDNWPNSEAAATYASVLHYLKIVAVMGAKQAKTSGRAVVEAMKKMPTDDDCFGKGRIREDGRLLVPTHLFQVKKPSESSSSWDVFKLVATTPAEQAFRPIAEGGCSF